MPTITVVLAVVAAACILGGFLASRYSDHFNPDLRVDMIDACPGCGGHHDIDDADTVRDENAVRTAEYLAAAATVLVHGSVDIDQFGRPGAVLVVVPAEDGNSTEVRWVIHPDAYADVADLLSTISSVSAGAAMRQGQINEDLHRMRSAGGEGK